MKNAVLREDEPYFEVSNKTVASFHEEPSVCIRHKAALVPIGSVYTLSGTPASDLVGKTQAKKKTVLSFEREQITLLKRTSQKYYLISGKARLCELVEKGVSAITGIVYFGPKNKTEELLSLLLKEKATPEIHFFDVAAIYYKIIRLANVSQKELASWFGLSQPSIGNKVRLLQLSESVRQAAIRARLTERHCRALLDIGDENLQLRVISFIVKYNTSAKKAEEIRKYLLTKRKTCTSDKEYSRLLENVFMLSNVSITNEISSFITNLERDVRILKSIGVDAKLDIKSRENGWDVSLVLIK